MNETTGNGCCAGNHAIGCKHLVLHAEQGCTVRRKLTDLLKAVAVNQRGNPFAGCQAAGFPVLGLLFGTAAETRHRLPLAKFFNFFLHAIHGAPLFIR